MVFIFHTLSLLPIRIIQCLNGGHIHLSTPYFCEAFTKLFQETLLFNVINRCRNLHCVIQCENFTVSYSLFEERERESERETEQSGQSHFTCVQKKSCSKSEQVLMASRSLNVSRS